MVRNVSKEEKVEDLRKKLIRKVREEEKKRAMDLQNLTEKIITTVKEAMMNHKREGGVSIRRCFYCDRSGHVARSCYWRKAKEGYNINKSDSKYFIYDGEAEGDSEIINERGYKKTEKGRIKISKPVIIYESRVGSKRKKLNLEDYTEEFREVLVEDDSKISYCKLEKCKIITEEGKKVFKKEQTVPQALIKDTVIRLGNLKKGI